MPLSRRSDGRKAQAGSGGVANATLAAARAVGSVLRAPRRACKACASVGRVTGSSDADRGIGSAACLALHGKEKTWGAGGMARPARPFALVAIHMRFQPVPGGLSNRREQANHQKKRKSRGSRCSGSFFPGGGSPRSRRCAYPAVRMILPMWVPSSMRR